MYPLLKLVTGNLIVSIPCEIPEVNYHLGCLPFGQKIQKFWFEVKW